MSENESTTVHAPQMGAVFDDRAQAEAAVADLRESGLADEHLGLAVHESDSYVFEEDVGAELTHGLERGIAIGAPVGAIAGMTVLALIAPGVGAFGVAGILAGGATGALAGGFWGAYLGLTAEEHVMEEEWDWERTPLREGQVLLVVDQHGHPDTVERILQGHGGQIIAKPSHIGPSAP